ncbi:MAG: helix-turn-helix transcriptional regulator [Bacteroidales bacterium]|jgi:transcriptional regulator with XRE-family HTH domain|nr:helix-turn-helix transcriptional regulator [Bacteroidales bacterium]
MRYRNIYIGRLIKQQFEQKNISIAQFAKAIHCSRASIYNIFEAKSIDIDKLILISEALDYNFLEEYLLNDALLLNTHITLAIELKDNKLNIKHIKDGVKIIDENV